MKMLYILMIRFPGRASKIMEFLHGCRYPHASIGLEEDLNTFYSFVKKGFIVEKVTRYVKPDRRPYPCRLYRLPVQDEVYAEVKARLGRFACSRQQYRYTQTGLILSNLRIPFKRRYHYFCSHFVAEVLKYTDSAPLRLPSSMYLSSDLERLADVQLVYEGDLKHMIERFELKQQLADSPEQGAAMVTA